MSDGNCQVCQAEVTDDGYCPRCGGYMKVAADGAVGFYKPIETVNVPRRQD